MNSLFKNIKKATNQYYTDNYNIYFLCHNFGLILQLSDALQELFEEETSIKAEEQENLKIALLLHQVGYHEDFENAGNTTITVAKSLLEHEKASDEKIDLILSLILATKKDHEPTTALEAIIHDAAFSFLAFKNFDEITALWKEETVLNKGQEYTKQEWNAELKTFFANHQFYTDIAQKKWSQKLHNNLLTVIKSVSKSEKKKGKSEKIATKKTDKGRDTIFRTTLRNHISLSDNADRKAHIILTVNSIVISIIFSRIFPKLDNPSNVFLYVPSLVFLGFTVASIILSIIATRPRITVGTFTKEQVKNKNVNLLFFGNFYRMKIQEFEWAMEQLLNDDEYIYKSLSKDLYYLGKVVAKKYRILQVTYAVFMVGIIVSSILYIVYFNMYN